MSVIIFKNSFWKTKWGKISYHVNAISSTVHLCFNLKRFSHKRRSLNKTRVDSVWIDRMLIVKLVAALTGFQKVNSVTRKTTNDISTSFVECWDLVCTYHQKLFRLEKEPGFSARSFHNSASAHEIFFYFLCHNLAINYQVVWLTTSRYKESSKYYENVTIQRKLKSDFATLQISQIIESF